MIKNQSSTSAEGLTLAKALPELTEWLRAALTEASRPELAERIGNMAVRSCWPGMVGNFNVGMINRRDYLAERPIGARESISLYQPKGVARRRWQVGLLTIESEPVMVGISRPGILRRALLRLSDKLGE